MNQVKAKIAVIKEEVNDTLPDSMKSKAPIELRARKPRGAFDEERPFHGFYAVEKPHQDAIEEKESRKIPLTKKEDTPAKSSTPASSQTSEVESLRSRISEMENQSQKTSEEKMKLEQQLEELSKRFESDESALSKVESERKRFKNLISVEQRKCFDFQQQIVALKNQLKQEHDAAAAAATQQAEIMKQNKKENKKAEKKKESTPAPAQSAPKLEQHSAWHGASHTQDYTQLVAQAQREELDSGKTFSEVLKESLKPAEPASNTSSKKDEFTIVGGADSAHHVFAPVSAI